MKKWLGILVNIVFYGSLAVVGYLLLQVFLLVSFKVPTNSMVPEIMPGDFILVEKLSMGPRLFNVFKATRLEDVEIYRLPGLRGIKQNDVVVFNFPYEYGRWDSIRFHVMKYYTKRCIGLPGDTLSIRNGLYQIVGEKGEIGKRLQQMELAMFSDSILFERYPDPVYPEASAGVGMGWTLKEFGPLPIPQRGQSIQMDSTTWKLYHQLVEWEQKQKLTIDHEGVVRLGNEVIDAYTFTHDYYFMAGDNAISSIDSRFWGLVPDDYIVGRVWRIWKSVDRKGKVRWDRIGKKV
ncbi:MAG: signal peptidase I [Bacteroidaceae bacterium]|nr:signal peptidase I [Bacteroidaceae bacterium]